MTERLAGHGFIQCTHCKHQAFRILLDISELGPIKVDITFPKPIGRFALIECDACGEQYNTDFFSEVRT
jgi:hypothetical protein